MALDGLVLFAARSFTAESNPSPPTKRDSMIARSLVAGSTLSATGCGRFNFCRWQGATGPSHLEDSAEQAPGAPSVPFRFRCSWTGVRSKASTTHMGAGAVLHQATFVRVEMR